MNSELIALIKETFHKKLQAKTSWGKNEVANLFNESVAEASVQMIDKL